jgi:hypothetical protein
MIYELHYIGGPMDGQEVLSPRPFDIIVETDGSAYVADCEGEECLEWVDDETRRITLHYAGKRPCGNPRCGVSSGIHEGLTFGSGELDSLGFWSKPCSVCARAHEAQHPEGGPCWPFAEKDRGSSS